MEAPLHKIEKKNFDFVDSIRCISMIGIVWEHSSAVATNIYHDTGSMFMEAFMIQLFKFSTIAFFLIGGFLINHKFQEYTAFQYLRNRINNTIKPWLFWMFIFIIITIIDRYVAYRKGSDVGYLVTDFPRYLGDLVHHTLFNTAYWFILNFLVCITVLLIFKKYLYKLWFGFTLFTISLIYSVNIYFQWFVTTHSQALFGFIFYLWLGVYFNKYYGQTMSYIKKTSWIKMISLALITFLLAISESFILLELGSNDNYNTLRISNIIFSLVMFALLLKVGNIGILQRKLQPRQTTFGIYLLHFLIIDRVLPLLFRPLKLDLAHYNVWQNTGLLMSRFVITYVLCVIITKLLLKTKAKWMVGQT